MEGEIELRRSSRCSGPESGRSYFTVSFDLALDNIETWH